MTPSREAFPKEPVSLESLPRDELPYGGNRLRSTPRTGSMRGSTDSWGVRGGGRSINEQSNVNRT